MAGAALINTGMVTTGTGGLGVLGYLRDRLVHLMTVRTGDDIGVTVAYGQLVWVDRGAVAVGEHRTRGAQYRQDRGIMTRAGTLATRDLGLLQPRGSIAFGGLVLVHGLQLGFLIMAVGAGHSTVVDLMKTVEVVSTLAGGHLRGMTRRTITAH